MFKSRQFPNWFSAFVLSFAIFATSLTSPAEGQRRAKPRATAPKATAAPSFTVPLEEIEKAIDRKRQDLGIPGASLVIVKNDKVIYMKGLGVKDLERKKPVTPDTLFAIGSASKAFTSMLAVMAADEHKLSLDDSPKKFLPYFKLRDPDADAKITLRDLLSHRSGLNRTDLAMVTGVLNREELIQVAAMAKPTAKLGEKFQYQNVMYTAAGEAVARAEHSTWDKLIAMKILRPLGMFESDTTVTAMQKSRDFSFGYDFNTTTKVTRRLPQREISAAAPAGAINSSVRDMAQWLRFMLAGGVFNGKRLVSKTGFAELVSKQMNVAGPVDYGLGWFLRQWNGHKVIEHGGNIDGFNAQVAMMPDQQLGFVLLTNVTASSLGGFAMNTVWKSLVGNPNASETAATGPAVDPKTEVGSYKLASASLSFEVTMKEGQLILTVPGQPPYPLENVTGRRYKLAAPAPPGFFATFRPAKAKATETELYLEQPQGDIVLTRVAAESAVPDSGSIAEGVNGPLKEMVGSYESESSRQVIEIGVKDGKVSLVVPGQPPYPLTEEGSKLRSPNLPAAYWIDVNRDATGVVSGIVINQPEGRFTFRRMGTTTNSLISSDELISRMIEAYGGEENLRKHKSSVTTVEIDMENQGVQAQGTVSARAPNLVASNITITALGKKLGSITTYFDGNRGGEVISFAPEVVYSGKRLEDIRIGADFYDLLNWKTLFKTITVKRIAKVGDEDAYVIEKRSEKGTPVTDYVSTKSFLLLRRDSLIAADTSGVDLPQTAFFTDYRTVDGVKVPFRAVSNNLANGDIVTVVKELKFDVEIPDSTFSKPAKP